MLREFTASRTLTNYSVSALTDYLLMSCRLISCFPVQESSKQRGKKAQKEYVLQYSMKTDNHLPSTVVTSS